MYITIFSYAIANSIFFGPNSKSPQSTRVSDLSLKLSGYSHAKLLPVFLLRSSAVFLIAARLLCSAFALIAAAARNIFAAPLLPVLKTRRTHHPSEPTASLAIEQSHIRTACNLLNPSHSARPCQSRAECTNHQSINQKRTLFHTNRNFNIVAKYNRPIHTLFRPLLRYMSRDIYYTQKHHYHQSNNTTNNKMYTYQAAAAARSNHTQYSNNESRREKKKSEELDGEQGERQESSRETHLDIRWHRAKCCLAYSSDMPPLVCNQQD